MLPFSPSSTTVNISVGASTANVKLTNQRGEVQVRVVNNGSATAWIAFGDSNVAATLAASAPMPPASIDIFTVVAPYSGDLYVAAIAAGATGVVYFTPGAGI